MSAIHKKLKTMRENLGLSQKQIAAYLGVSQIFISKVESGERTFTVDQLESILALYGCSLAWFVDRKQDVPPISFAFHVQEVNPEDLRAISEIGKIVSNSRDFCMIGEGR